jgi:DNA-binding transcriptional ArsR family regulator
MHPIDNLTATRLADLFSALGDPARLRLISALLEGERSVGELAEAIGLSESATSHQLRGLRNLRLVRPRKEGRQVFYCLDDEHVTRLFQMGLDHVIHG